jgi:hypothetical protein
LGRSIIAFSEPNKMGPAPKPKTNAVRLGHRSPEVSEIVMSSKKITHRAIP